MEPLKPPGGLGRLPAPDPRDRAYPIRTLLSPIPSPRLWRYWNAEGWWGDQGLTPQCVGYSWCHWLEDGPVTRPGLSPIIPPPDIYHQAQLIDEWPGEGYPGTSVRAGAKVLQTLGYITEYRWAFDLNDLIRSVLDIGPVVVGTDWLSGMSEPDAVGKVRPSGEYHGGHAYLVNGVNVVTRTLRCKNSWGRQFGKRGHFYISFSDFSQLLVNGGEACIAIER